MTIATISYSTENFDKIQIVINGDVPQMIVLKDQYSALELNRQLTVAYFQDHEDKLDIEIDGNPYTFPLEVWQAILSVTDQWLAKYMVKEGYHEEG